MSHHGEHHTLADNDTHGSLSLSNTSRRWETSREGAQLLLDYGVEYDHSMAHHDCQAYYLPAGESWTKIDYTKKAEEWMKPLENGPPTGLVEIPTNWYLDDLPPMMFIKAAPNSHGFVNSRDVEDIWRDHFDYFYREYDEFIFPMTVHPDVSGRPHAILMHERYVDSPMRLCCLQRMNLH